MGWASSLGAEGTGATGAAVAGARARAPSAPEATNIETAAAPSTNWPRRRRSGRHSRETIELRRITELTSRHRTREHPKSLG